MKRAGAARRRKKYGIVGGLGAVASADILLKLVKSTPALGDHDHLDISFEQHAYDDAGAVADETYNPNHRKFHVYDTLKEMERRGCEVALLPCFISHCFLEEIAPELGLSILNILDAMREALERDFPDVRRIGVLTSSFVRKQRLFDRAFQGDWEVIYPDPQVQAGAVMEAVYGAEGIKAGRLRGRSVTLIAEACRELTDQGAEVIVPGFTEIPILCEVLRSEIQTPILDSNQAYANHAIAYDSASGGRAFKLGVVGGVGPAATVDFMDKVVRRTKAARDQDHIKMVVEQNPQIPDRTANLVGEGEDPTIPLYATCKRLESEGADAIAIPCNTAHAFVERIQRHLDIPIINMLSETVDYIRRVHPGARRVGLLATLGTVQSGVYQEILEAADLSVVLPDQPMQQRVMEAIYGEAGVKAGFMEGSCRDHLAAAITEVGAKGAEVAILGCTELPLIAPEAACDGLILLDPTEILALRCVSLAQGEETAIHLGTPLSGAAQ